LKNLFTYLLFVLNSSVCVAQHDVYWPFGDSAAIKFNNNMPVASYSGLHTLETSSAYCDSAGNVVAYIGSGIPTNKLIIFNRLHQVMLNGDSINGYSSASQGSLIIPYPGSNDSLMVFTISQIVVFPIFYWRVYSSIISLSGDSGRGVVMLANDTLSWNYIDLTEKMIAVRHGNGRDWWLILHSAGMQLNKNYITYLITPSGIHGPFTQNIPSSNYHFAGDIMGQMSISAQGDKIAFAGGGGTLDVLDFDRCSGILTLQYAYGFNTQSMQNGYYGCSFSQDGTKLYVSQTENYGHDSIFQCDLNSNSKKFLWVSPDSVTVGQHMRGPDGKIYITCSYGLNNSTTLDSANQYLSVINSPNDSGLLCNFVPYQTWLGGHKSWIGLPNIPNYNLGRMDGSPCDSLGNVGIAIPDDQPGLFQIYPNPANEKIFIAYNRNYQAKSQLTITDLTGQVIIEKNFSNFLKPQEINVSGLAPGIYFVTLHTMNNNHVKKFIKQ
jgi:hypothetical protein